MGSWRRCEACRKVKGVEEYDEGSAVCSPCRSGPPPAQRRTAAPVTRRVRPTAAPVAPAAPRRPATGPVGSGDLEARERRAKRIAWEQLAELHEQEYQELLQLARRAEGLRT